MLIFNNLEEMKPHHIEEDDTYVFEDDITINFPLNVDAHINARAWNITALNITARDIEAWNITARDIDARDIIAVDIEARNINAGCIDVTNIEYWAVCIARLSFKCKSVKGRRENSIHKCLDQEIEFIKD